MYARKSIVIALALILLLGPVTTFASNKISQPEQTKAQLLEQIQKLLAEVLRLQAILKERTATKSQTFSNYTPYQAVFFSLPTERIYLVDNDQLINLKRTETVRTVDKQLFDLFVDVVGEEAVESNLKEWRVFKNDSSDLGAFVELIAGTEDWIMGVNRDGYIQGDRQVIESFINLYIHEYGHILLFSKPDFEKYFKSSFWNKSDNLHESKVKQASASAKFAIMSNYYSDNQNRFVSDYATMNAEEDMAEAFLAFVLEDKPIGNR